jgi:hypothetical protein
LIVNVALRVTPFNVALIVAVPVAVTATVPIVNVPDDAPAAIVTLAGTVARVLLLARLTTVAAGALALNVTVPCTLFPPTTELGFSARAATVNAGGGGGGCVVEGTTVTPTSRRPSRSFDTRTVTLRDELTFLAVPRNLTLDVPADMNAFDGTERTAELLLETENVKPFDGATAPATSVMRISVVFPLTTVEGVAVTLPYAGWTTATPVVFSATANPGLAPTIGNAMSTRPSRLKSPDASVPPPMLDCGGGIK